MKIIFDMAYDHGPAPDGICAGEAAIGRLFIGIQGLLGLLETQLGLEAKSTHHANRIQEYMECMGTLRNQSAGSFFSSSFAADAWSSAKQMLAWRDELMLAGWDGRGIRASTPRLTALAAVENGLTGTAVRRGIGDRMTAVLNALTRRPTLAVEEILLRMPPEQFPARLQRLIAALEDCGVAIKFQAPEPAYSDGNLGAIKRAMLSHESRTSVVSGDDSLVFLQADDEWSAANVLAAWLDAEHSDNHRVLLIQEQGSELLDAALHRVGLPIQGANNRSPWRAALQVLPLALANIWRPLDIHALMEFLSLPVSPIPAFAAKELRRAIQHEPGIGGERWKKAETSIVNIRHTQLTDAGLDDEEARCQARAFMDNIHHFIVDDRVDPKAGISAERLEEICRWVREGLQHPALQRDMSQALAQADCMINLAQNSTHPLSRAQVERMLDSVIAEGGVGNGAVAQAAPWWRVSHPGAIAGAVDTIVWWGFNDHGQPATTFWSATERAALAGIGVQLEPSVNIRKREAEFSRRALRYAGKRLILIAPSRLKGETVQPHPIWDEIRHFASSKNESDPRSVYQRVITHAKHVCRHPTGSFAGRSITLRAEDSATLPKAKPSIHVDAGSITKPEKLSFTQMSTMLGCPAKWAMQYHAELETMDSLSLPSGNTMIGSLCHKVVETLYTHPDRWDTGHVRDAAADAFDDLVPKMAAELLISGRELERKRYRDAVCDAVEALVHAIRRAGLRVVRTEGWVDGKELDGIPFGGYIDLLLEDDNSHRYVIDLKWSGSSKYKREEIESGGALQLASYAWLLRRGNGPWAAGAYFMLAQGELLTADSRFRSSRTIESPKTVEAIWRQGEHSWKSMFQRCQQGEIEVSGLVDERELKEQRTQDGIMTIKPPCHFCHFGKLCGVTRNAA